MSFAEARASHTESIFEKTAEKQKELSHPGHIHVEIAHVCRKTFHSDSSNLSRLDGIQKLEEKKRQTTDAHAEVGMATAPVVPSLLSIKHREFHGAPVWRQAST